MTPARRRALLALTPLGNWVAAQFDFDETKVHRDHGRFAPGDGAGPTDTGPAPEPAAADWKPGDKYRPDANYGDGVDRPSVGVYPEALPADLKKRTRGWEENMSSAQRWAFQAYTSNVYTPINRALREAGGDPAKVPETGVRRADAMSMTVKECIDRMTEAADKAPTHPVPLTAWRKMDLTFARMNEFRAAATVAAATGGTVRFPVFSSATLNPEYAANVSGGITDETEGKPSAVTGIVPKKTSILLEIRSRTGMVINGFSGHAEENEILQSPKAEYRVLGWKDVKFGKKVRRVLRLEEVAKAGAQ